MDGGMSNTLAKIFDLFLYPSLDTGNHPKQIFKKPTALSLRLCLKVDAFLSEILWVRRRIKFY